MRIAGRKVLMFRTHYDVMIGPKAMKAYHMNDTGLANQKTEACVNEQETGVYVRTTRNKVVEEHFIPMANIEAIRFYAEEAAETTKPLPKSKSKDQAQASA